MSNQQKSWNDGQRDRQQNNGPRNDHKSYQEREKYYGGYKSGNTGGKKQ